MRPLSHSSIKLYEDCPKKWYFKYIEKLPEKEKPFFSFGKSLHSALEFLYKDQGLLFPSLEELLKTYEQVWLTKGYESPESEENYKAEGRQILTEYYEKNKAVFRRPLAVEHQFNLEVSGIKVIGFIDRIDKVAGDRLSIVDYKTGKEITRKRAATDPQLTMYQMACEQDFGLKADSLIFYHLNSQTPVTSGPHSEEQVRSLRENIVRVGTAIQKAIAADDNGRDFKPDPGEPKCNWCDFRPHCPVWAHQYAKKSPPAVTAAPPSPGLGDDMFQPAAQPAAGHPRDDERLAKLVDLYGELHRKIEKDEERAEKVKAEILAALREHNYVKAFGTHYQAVKHESVVWEFGDEKRPKVLEIIRSAGYWDQVVGPMMVKVQTLLKDVNTPFDLKDRIQRLGKEVLHTSLRVSKVKEEE